jgi:hypothetical protein
MGNREQGDKGTRGENLKQVFPLVPNSPCPQFPIPMTYTRGECASLVLWFRVELAIKLNKTANGV